MIEETHNEYQVCYKHPDRKTYLRCNKCGRPICLECSVQTPTGYRCKDCIKTQQKVFDTAEKKDYFIGAAIAAVLGFAGTFVMRLIPFLPVFVAALIFATAFGKIICSAVRAAFSKRRSQTLTRVVAAAAAVGALAGMWQEIIVNINIMSMGMMLNGLMQIIVDILYIVIQSVTILSDMNGMVFRK
ncbi:MAG: hypothetical protein II969_00720 [Anaerolineaceae bacterium]|nr:hypothetical protein [Anaerolineaceae bacterium]